MRAGLGNGITKELAMRLGLNIGLTRRAGGGGAAGPTNTVAPAITGTLEIGETLSVSNGTWTGEGAISYTYQWRRDGGNISGATSSAYTLVAADDETTVSCTVTATDDNGSRGATATGGAVTYPAPVAAGGLADLNLTLGEAMTPVDVSADFTGSGITYALAPSSDALPTGLSLSSAGSLSGTPTEEVTGRNIVVRGTNSGGFADSAFTLSVVNITSEATQGTVTFTVAGSYTTGNYADGPAYIVIPSGSADMDEPTPLETTVGSDVVNGCQVNPTQTGDQGYDERGEAWNGARRNTTWPLSVSAGDIIVKAVHQPTYSELRDGVVAEYAACYIVASEPAANSFAPAAIGWAGRGTPAASVIDISAQVAALPEYDTTGYTLPAASMLTGESALWNPIVAQSNGSSVGAVAWYQFNSPNALNEGGSNYGAYWGSLVNACSLALISSDYTTAQKEAIATGLVSWGKQWWDTFKETGDFYVPNGGHYQFHLAPIALYLDWSGQSAELANFLSTTGGNFLQAFQFSASQAADMAPHTDTSKPFTWRERNLNAISGTTLTVETYRLGILGDSPNFGMTGMTITNGTAEAVVQSFVGSPPANTTGSVDVIVDDATGFAVNDTVWFVPEVVPVEGDYDWTLNGTNSWNKYNPNIAASYRSLNTWTGQVLLLKALDIWHSSLDAVSGYVIDANKADFPAAGWDWPTHNAAAPAFDSEFWNDHSDSILGLSSTPLLVDNNGTANLTIPGSMLPASNQATISFIVGNATGTLNFYLISNRIQIRQIGSDDLRLVLRRDGTNTTQFSGDWMNVLANDNANPDHVHFEINLGATSGDEASSYVKLYVNGVEQTLSSGGGVVGEFWGDIFFDLDTDVVGGTSNIDTTIGNFYFETGAARDTTNFYSGGPLDLTGVGSPQVLVNGDAAAWNAGTNNGSGSNLTVNSATFTDV